MPTIEKNNGDDQRRAETHLHTFEQLREHIHEQGRLIGKIVPNIPFK
jgi:hypothetical protein